MVSRWVDLHMKGVLTGELLTSSRDGLPSPLCKGQSPHGPKGPRCQNIRRKDILNTHPQASSSCGLGFLTTLWLGPKNEAGGRPNVFYDLALEVCIVHAAMFCCWTQPKRSCQDQGEGRQTSCPPPGSGES